MTTRTTTEVMDGDLIFEAGLIPEVARAALSSIETRSSRRGMQHAVPVTCRWSKPAARAAEGSARSSPRAGGRNPQPTPRNAAHCTVPAMCRSSFPWCIGEVLLLHANLHGSHGDSSVSMSSLPRPSSEGGGLMGIEPRLILYHRSGLAQEQLPNQP